MLAAKEKTIFGGAVFPQMETRVWGLPPGNHNGVGGSWPVTSTLAWGWPALYPGSASDQLDQRYYNSNIGSFWSPDPGGIKSAKPRNPESWNRYAYVHGDPINFGDPHGKEDCKSDFCTTVTASGDIDCADNAYTFQCYDPVAFGETSGSGVGASDSGDQGGSGNPYAALQAVANHIATLAASVIDTGCNGLFGDPTDAAQLLQVVADNQIVVVPFQAPAPGVGAQTNQSTDTIYIASNRYFFTGILANGSSVLDTPDFSGLTMLQMQETIIIHEFLHLEGFVGADNNNQQIVLPNGQTVVGSTGVTQAVKSNCFGVQ